MYCLTDVQMRLLSTEEQRKPDFFCINSKKSLTYDCFNASTDLSFPYQLWGFRSLLPKSFVVLVSQKWGRYKLGTYKNSLIRESMRETMEEILSRWHEGREKANANLMEIHFDISMFEQEILTGLIWFKITKSKDLRMHTISWSHINNFAWPSGKFSVHVSFVLK